MGKFGENHMIRVGQPYFFESDISEITSRIALVLRSGWLTSSELVAEFEGKFSKTIDMRYAVAVNSCTAALHVILSALHLEPDYEVIVPANTFASTVNAALYVGAKPVLADCDSETFNVTAKTIECRISPKTKAVIITHIAGNPCEMDEIVRLCQERNLILVEDAAHTPGSKYKGRNCGSFGLASAFSFYPTKVMTSGEGGIVVTNSEEVYEHAKLLRNVGRTGMGPGSIIALGYNYRMSEIHAVIALNQLKHLDEFVKKRNQLARIYNEELSGIGWLEPQYVYGHSICSYYAYIVRLLPTCPISRDAIMEYLKKEGIETTIMFRPIHQHHYYRVTLDLKDNYPNAEFVGAHTIALPMHAAMNIKDVEYIVSKLRSLGKQ